MYIYIHIQGNGNQEKNIFGKRLDICFYHLFIYICIYIYIYYIYMYIYIAYM